MISQKLHNAINAQINAELWSAYLYLAMSLDAEAKGYKGFANWFYIIYINNINIQFRLQCYFRNIFTFV